MAQDPKISNAAAIVACDTLVDLLDAGTPPGLIKVYDDTGAVPATADTALGSSVLLATLTFSTTAFGGAADGAPGAVAVAAAITGSATDTDGTVLFFRATNAAGTAVFQGEIGGADTTINAATVDSGVQMGCAGLIVTIPEG